MRRSSLLPLLLLAALCTAPDSDRGRSRDEPIAATFVDGAGNPISLASYRGKQGVVLLFMRGFKGDFACYYCGLQLRAYKAAYEAVRSAGGEVVAVLPGAHDVAGFLEKVGTSDESHPEPGFSVPFPVVLDPDFAACRTFSVSFDPSPDAFPFPVSEPATVVVGKDGSLVYAYHGTAPPDRPAVDAIVEILKHGPPKIAAPRASPTSTTAPALAWTSYAEGTAAARAAGRPLLLDFHAVW